MSLEELRELARRQNEAAHKYQQQAEAMTLQAQQTINALFAKLSEGANP